jgi:type IV fimbrial biogenesis protein FimT
MMQRTATSPPIRAVRLKIRNALGFTMIEMLITIAIAAILMGLAIPSFRFVTNSNRIAGELNGLLVFSDPINVGAYDAGETYIRKQKPFSGTDTFLASNNVTVITFNREGYAVGMANGTLLTLHDSTNTSAWTRCLSINLSGQMTSELQGITTNGVTCT